MYCVEDEKLIFLYCDVLVEKSLIAYEILSVNYEYSRLGSSSRSYVNTVI